MNRLIAHALAECRRLSKHGCRASAFLYMNVVHKALIPSFVKDSGTDAIQRKCRVGFAQNDTVVHKADAIAQHFGKLVPEHVATS